MFINIPVLRNKTAQKLCFAWYHILYNTQKNAPPVRLVFLSLAADILSITLGFLLLQRQLLKSSRQTRWILSPIDKLSGMNSTNIK